MKSVPNIFTVDLEEWFVVEALSRMYRRDDWASLHSMVVKNSFRLLELLDRKDVKATWFVLLRKSPPRSSTSWPAMAGG